MWNRAAVARPPLPPLSRARIRPYPSPSRFAHVSVCAHGRSQEEQVEYTCSECGAASAGTRLCHVIKRLPRIVVLHIKRFAVDMAAREIRKRHDAIFFPNVLDLCMSPRGVRIGTHTFC